jgi:hypothetical protein
VPKDDAQPPPFPKSQFGLRNLQKRMALTILYSVIMGGWLRLKVASRGSLCQIRANGQDPRRSLLQLPRQLRPHTVTQTPADGAPGAVRATA